MYRQQLRRRSFLLKSIAGLIGLGLSVSERVGTVKAETPDVCFWRHEGTACNEGQLEELWCFVCCEGPRYCETLECEWRPVGSC